MSSNNPTNIQQVDLLLIRTLIEKYNKSQSANTSLKQSIIQLEQEHSQLKQQLNSYQTNFEQQVEELKREQAKAVDTLKSEYKVISEQSNITSQKKIEQLTQELTEIKSSYSAIITRIRGGE